jgi:homoserine O-acetyltransferase
MRLKVSAHALRIDPENLLVMAQTWQNGDVSKQEPYNGNFELAMASIKAKTLVMPCDHDLYFPWVAKHQGSGKQG